MMPNINFKFVQRTFSITTMSRLTYAVSFGSIYANAACVHATKTVPKYNQGDSDPLQRVFGRILDVPLPPPPSSSIAAESALNARVARLRPVVSNRSPYKRRQTAISYECTHARSLSAAKRYSTGPREQEQ